MTDLNSIKARLGSLSFEDRSKLAGHSPAAFKLVTVDLPAVIAELEAIRTTSMTVPADSGLTVADLWHQPTEDQP